MIKKVSQLWFLSILLAVISTPALALPILTTSPTSGAGNLDLDGEGSANTHIVKVADLSFSTDNVNGLTLEVTSGAIAKLAGIDIDFQVVTVADNASTPSQGDFTVPSGSTYTYATSDAGSENRDLYVLYTPGTLQDPGNYAGMITVSVNDNP